MRGSRRRKRSSKYPDRAAAPRESSVDAPCPGISRAQRGASAGGQTGSSAEFGGSNYRIVVIQDGDRSTMRLRSGVPSLLWTS
ncbi:hypothetical protein NDU88_009591 [Pleurodeles waltl]|uniref:Uncharacterized protein n=1 Tax=Pleurodeles waltl TaxID=8319 RepID=A0AAV7S050_PLEWA|nr:hypothetical protein NDU88_009591 [Pleurodeles waltl]